MRTNAIDAAQLATQIVGDGKKPNKYFITIAYGYWRPKQTDPEECPEMEQAKNSLDSVTMGPFTSKGAAEAVYNAISLDTDILEVTGQMIGEVVMEDRLTGVVKNKFLAQRRSYGFFVDEIE